MLLSTKLYASYTEWEAGEINKIVERIFMTITVVIFQKFSVSLHRKIYRSTKNNT